MWPLDLRRGSDVVRVGAHAVELWRGSPSAFGLVAHEPLPRRGSMFDAEAIVEPLRALARRVAHARALLVLESAFVPVLLADTGGMLSNGQQVEALLRHRFGLTYGGPGIDLATWKLRTDYRFGDRYALGFAMAPAVEVALAEVAQSAKLVFTSWVPALAWGFDRFTPWRRWPRRTGWWVWPEQDRTLLASFARGRVEALNPAAARCDTVREIEQSIAIEGVRTGTDVGASPIGLAHWQTHDRPKGASDRVRWFAVETAEAAPIRSSSRNAQELHAAVQ